jgi:phosphate regulon transcriptional regulator PhoB
MPKNILVVDDEKDIVELIAYNLEREDYAVVKAYDGRQALAEIGKSMPDLMILDLMMPGMSGLDVCRIVRSEYGSKHLPIVMLTAKSDLSDKILGLELGADDYVTKPFNIRELFARIRAVMRRVDHEPTQDDPPDIFTWNGLTIDYRSYEVSVDGAPVDLGPMESKLLYFFSRHPGRVYSRKQILDHVWKDEVFVEPRTVDAHISRLRSAIEKDKDRPRYIFTVRSVGYKFAETK